MRHLRQFNESIKPNEEYFKDKIDWKIVDRLQDISTEYSDVGYSVSVTISTIDYERDFTNNQRVLLRTEIHKYQVKIDPDSGQSKIITGYIDPGNINYLPENYERNKRNYEKNKTILYSIMIFGIKRDEIEHVKNKLSKYKPEVRNEEVIYIFLKNE